MSREIFDFDLAFVCKAMGGGVAGYWQDFLALGVHRNQGLRAAGWKTSANQRAITI